MEAKFQSSFIPKKPLSDSQKVLGPVKKNTNIFSVIATLVFLVTIFVSGGLFVYEKIVEKQLVDTSKELDAARAAFETDKIQDLIDASTRLNSVKGMLEKHFAVSELLVLMQNYTVKTIQFNNFKFDNKSSNPLLSMDGEALSYNAVAKQSEVFAGTGFINNTLFSDFTLTDSGSVKFKFIGSVATSLVSYKEAVKAISGEQQ